jgi:DNA repair ATPase RecN
MSPVLQRCAALQARMKQLDALISLRGEAETLTQRRKELAEVRAALQIAMAQTQVLLAHGHMPTWVWPSTAKVRAAWSRVQQKLQEQPSQLSSGEDYRELLLRTRKLAEKLQQAIDPAWAGVWTEVNPVDERLLQRFAEVPGQQAAIEEVRQRLAALRPFQAFPPQTEAEYDQIQQAAMALQQAWQALNQGDLPDAVVRFFRAAQSKEGAPETLWTEEVRDWLGAHDLLQQVRIFYRGGT